MCWRASVALAAFACAAACGGPSSAATPAAPKLGPVPQTPAERILGLLPAGAQVVVEIDLARLRQNAVIGGLVTRAIAGDQLGLPDSVAGTGGSPLATAELLVLAAYGVGTAEAATVTVLAAPAPIADTIRVAEGLYAIGPEAWVGQVEQRAAITVDAPLGAPADLLELRDRAMPPKAPGASIRITAQLSFDARVALARQVGLENAPGQVSVWADVVDDLAIVIDADSSDPGEKTTKQSVARLEATMKGALSEMADLAAVRALGLPSSLAGAKLVVRGTWVRTIIAIGPNHLKRVAERAEKLLP
jgi:hypothetical protein